ncbi:hypothetical protein [Leptolyngbya sp. FACHB-16]|nr:hypothetical protein [Leptolyngbya sp. FACHB-16]
MIPVAFPTNGFQEIARQVLSTRRLTRAHQSYFMTAALSSNSLSEDELATLDRLFHAVQRGLVRVVD